MNTHIQYEGALPMLNKVHSRRRVDHLGQDLNGRQPPLRGYGMFDGLIGGLAVHAPEICHIRAIRHRLVQPPDVTGAIDGGVPACRFLAETGEAGAWPVSKNCHAPKLSSALVEAEV